MAASVHFYRRFAAFPLLVSAGMVWMLYNDGPVFLTPALLIKAGILAISLWTTNHSAGSRMFYYYNLGLSKTRLFLHAAIFDAVLFFLPAIIVLWLRPTG